MAKRSPSKKFATPKTSQINQATRRQWRILLGATIIMVTVNECLYFTLKRLDLEYLLVAIFIIIVGAFLQAILAGNRLFGAAESRRALSAYRATAIVYGTHFAENIKVDSPWHRLGGAEVVFRGALVVLVYALLISFSTIPLSSIALACVVSIFSCIINAAAILRNVARRWLELRPNLRPDLRCLITTSRTLLLFPATE